MISMNKMVHFDFIKSIFRRMNVWSNIQEQKHAFPAPLILQEDSHILKLNRNAREPKLANHGARPNSSVMRRLRKSGNYQKWKEKNMPDAQDSNPKHTTSLEDEDEDNQAPTKTDSSTSAKK